MIRELDIFRAVGDETRFRIVALLSWVDFEISASELKEVVAKPQYTISKCMGVLCRAGIVEERKDGKAIYYRLQKDHPHIKFLISSVISIVEFDSYKWKKDFERLEDRLLTRQF